MKKKIKILMYIAVICSIANCVSAVPTWRTDPCGIPPTTYQMWTFDDDDNPAIPEISFNSYGTASAYITTYPGSSTGNQSGWDSTGMWFGEKVVMDLTIPNNPVSNQYKEIWGEVVCLGHFPPDVENPPSEGYSLGTGYEVLSPSGSSVEDLGFTFESMNNGMRKLTFGLRISPNPDSEIIRFTLLNSGVWIDYVTVDTICIPEPATLAILGIGSMILIRRKT